MTSPGDVVLELKELTSALTTPEMQKEIQELKKECAGYTERLKTIKAATNHVTPEEKEQVGGEGVGSREGCLCRFKVRRVDPSGCCGAEGVRGTCFPV